MGEQESIEDILAELRAENSGKPCQYNVLADLNPTRQRQTPLEALLQKVKEEMFTPSPLTLEIVSQASSPRSHSLINYELQQVVTDIAKECQRQGQAKRQEQEKLATEWLAQLDWLSGEGIWFEKFARNYRSNLEAAIAYLFGE
jgi:hypothetical protein